MIETLKNYGEVKQQVNLKKYNTYRVSSLCKTMFIPNSIENLQEGLKYLKEQEIPYFILGNGSNCLFKDDYYDMVFISFEKLNKYKVNTHDKTITAEAGTMLPALTLESIKNGLTGLEFCANLPGTLGGSIYGNAGCYNACIMDYIEEVTVLNKKLELITLRNEDIPYGYRTTLFKTKKEFIILSAKIKLETGNEEASKLIIKERNIKRKESQPLDFPSAGSVFRNPEGDYAGRLIEFCGLKGTKLNDAQISKKHANFIINTDNASGMDLYTLIKDTQRIVKELTKVELLIEQEIIGCDNYATKKEA